MPPDPNRYIKITGAREHNLKNISISLPKDAFIVFTGVSGSGKSTLAFSTIYAEGQRRYIESLSSYARQFLDKINKPDVEKIEGLMPAIAIDQKSTSKNPRSTVGTMTEIYDYLRLLFARVGTPHCHNCGKKISHMTQSDIVSEILKLPHGTQIMILSPIISEKKGAFMEKIEALRKRGFVRAQIDGQIMRLDEEISLAKTKKHTIKLVIDRVSVTPENESRIALSVEKALNESFGELQILIGEEMRHYSLHFACFDCKISFEKLEPLSFSFNSPKGACPDCGGLGSKFAIDVKKIIDSSLPLNDGGVKLLFGFNRGYYSLQFKAFCEAQKIDMNRPFDALPQIQQNALLYGDMSEVKIRWQGQEIIRIWRGILQIAYDIFKDEKDFYDFMSEKICATCDGNRLRPESLAVRVAGLGIGELQNMQITKTHEFFTNDANFLYFSDEQRQIASQILKEIRERLFFLHDVGLGYLTLGRDARSISGGEAQRIRIARQIGSGLSGVLYVLDEPSIGLHERDTLKLIRTLKSLQNKGNTLIIVEHDKETIKNADFIVDIGPLAGKNGGEIVFSGGVQEMMARDTLTAQYLSRQKDILYRTNRPQENFIEIRNVRVNNIQDLAVKIPLKNFVCVTGVSGSGKSSLVLQTLMPIAQHLLNRAKNTSKSQGVEILGLKQLDKVIYLDQSPIGRTPRSNPATYTGLMSDIRLLFSETKDAKLMGFGISRFSFNLRGGRCEKCQGEGELKISMHFLPDVMVRCDACDGTKYNAQTLQIHYKGKNIAQILKMSVDEALDFFAKIPKMARTLKTMSDVGLGYIELGQNAITLSGGEAQRMKLASELCKRSTGKTLYVLDEPTTGLHFHDVDNLVKMLHELVNLGNSLIVIEHNLDLIKNADYIIDMGPLGGDGGGLVVDAGSVHDVASRWEKTGSFTGKFLAKELSEMGDF